MWLTAAVGITSTDCCLRSATTSTRSPATIRHQRRTANGTNRCPRGSNRSAPHPQPPQSARATWPSSTAPSPRQRTAVHRGAPHERGRVQRAYFRAGHPEPEPPGQPANAVLTNAVLSRGEGSHGPKHEHVDDTNTVPEPAQHLSTSTSIDASAREVSSTSSRRSTSPRTTGACGATNTVLSRYWRAHRPNRSLKPILSQDLDPSGHLSTDSNAHDPMIKPRDHRKAAGEPGDRGLHRPSYRDCRGREVTRVGVVTFPGPSTTATRSARSASPARKASRPDTTAPTCGAPRP